MIERKLLSRVALVAFVVGCSTTAPTSPTVLDAEPTDPNLPPPAGPTVEAQWTGVGHQAAGRVRLTIGGGRGRLEFQSDFSVQAVPAPYLYLNTATTPGSGRPLRIARLRANSGVQQYDFEVPAGALYSWILVWCDQFNVPVAEAKIP